MKNNFESLEQFQYIIKMFDKKILLNPPASFTENVMENIYLIEQNKNPIKFFFCNPNNFPFFNSLLNANNKIDRSFYCFLGIFFNLIVGLILITGFLKIGNINNFNNISYLIIIQPYIFIFTMFIIAASMSIIILINTFLFNIIKQKYLKTNI